MTGYTIKKALPSELIFSQPKFSMILIITLIGIILITLAILTKYKMINPPEIFFNLFLGMGIIFTAGSIIFMIQKIPDSIIFNKNSSMIVFSENSREYSVPFSAFSRLLITCKISHSENSTSQTYQLELISRKGSALLLCGSGDKAAVQEAAETIIKYIDIDLLSGGQILHSGKSSYPDIKPVYPPEEILSIKKSSTGNTSVYEWNSRKSLAAIILFGAVIFGFNFVIFTCAFPVMGKFNAGVYAGGAVIVIVDFFFIATFLFYLLGSNTAEVSDSGFSYRQKIFGLSMNSKTFSRDEVALISAGFTSEENKITIFTKRGMDIFNEMKVFAAMNDLNSKTALMSLLPKVMELRSNIIEIDGTPLFYYEKLYLENEWSERLKLQDDTHSVY